jgi:hypothetical protein
MQIGWFAWGYDTLMPWKEALVERVRASTVWRMGRLIKERVRRALLVQWRTWRPTVIELRAAIRAAATRLMIQVRRMFRSRRTPEGDGV